MCSRVLGILVLVVLVLIMFGVGVVNVYIVGLDVGDISDSVVLVV